MNLISFDTSGSVLGIAVSAEGLVTEHTHESPGHTEALIPSLLLDLETSGLTWDDINGVICSEGPGSFTGLRIGMATAKGISMARKIPVVSVSSTEAVAYAARERGITDREIITVIDARKRRFYAAAFSISPEGNVTRLTDDVDRAAHEIMETIPSGFSEEKRPLFAGPGVDRFTEALVKGGAQWALPESDLDGLRLDHTAVGLLNRGAALLADGKSDDGAKGPYYLREGDIGKRKRTIRFPDA